MAAGVMGGADLSEDVQPARGEVCGLGLCCREHNLFSGTQRGEGFTAACSNVLL